MTPEQSLENLPDRRERQPDQIAMEREEAPAREAAAKAIQRMVEAANSLLTRMGERPAMVGALAAKAMFDGIVIGDRHKQPMSARDVAILLGLCQESDPPAVQKKATEYVRNQARLACDRCHCGREKLEGSRKRSRSHTNCAMPCALRRGARLLTVVCRHARRSIPEAEFIRAKSVIERLR